MTSKATKPAKTTNEPERASTSEYAPEVEARRADYERLAEAIAHMTRLETSSIRHDKLDIDGPMTPDNDPHLINAIQAHLYALHLHVDWYDARTLRRFYTEMRLHRDQLEWERKRQAGEEVKD